MKSRKEYFAKWYAENIGRARDGNCAICGEVIQNNKMNRKLYCDAHTKSEKYANSEIRKMEKQKRAENMVKITEKVKIISANRYNVLN